MTAQLLRSAAENLRAGNFPAALDQARQALTGDPDALPALAMGALAALRLGRNDEAESLLRRQIALMPADLAARSNLAGLLVEQGRNAEALDLARDYGNHARLARIAGWLYQESGDAQSAQRAYEVAVAVNPADFRSWNNLGNLRLAQGDWKGGVDALERSIRHGADSPPVYVSLCQALRGQENRQGRLRAAADGLRRFPEDIDIALEYAGALAADWQTDEAIASFKQVAKGEDGFGRGHYELGLLYENLARLDDLEDLIAQADAKDWQAPELEFVRAWCLHRRGRTDEAAAALEKVPVSLDPMRVSQLRGQIADRQGDVDAAFAAFTEMNVAAIEQTPEHFIEVSSFRAFIDEGTAILPAAAQLAELPASPDSPSDPVFLVGFPRSGTTLLETLLGGLPELQGFEEMPMLARVQSDYPGLALETSVDRVADARAEFFEIAAELQGPLEGRRLLDKMPLHMIRVAEIQRLFPKADFILVERHPCDAVLSCFIATFTLNAGMRGFTELEETARIYDAAFTYWERATELLPVRTHRVRYEHMVADLENEIRPLVEFLGLPWRDDVLDNVAQAQRRRTVRSASYAQIGQPIYSHARERWRRYRRHLDPVLPILEPWIEKLGYEV